MVLWISFSRLVKFAQMRQTKIGYLDIFLGVGNLITLMLQLQLWHLWNHNSLLRYCCVSVWRASGRNGNVSRPSSPLLCSLETRAPAAAMVTDNQRKWQITFFYPIQRWRRLGQWPSRVSWWVCCCSCSCLKRRRHRPPNSCPIGRPAAPKSKVKRRRRQLTTPRMSPTTSHRRRRYQLLLLRTPAQLWFRAQWIACAKTAKRSTAVAPAFETSRPSAFYRINASPNCESIF